MTIKHKDENVFKFKKFSERINDVDLRSLALYKIDHVNELPEENQSYYYQCHEKWTTLNLTDEFTALATSLRGVNTITLPQVIHHREKIINCLLDAIDNSSILSIQPLLELTVALAKDLREDFYEHFEKFFARLVKLLKTQDANQTEWTLVCLAHLFKVLKSFLCKDIAVVVQHIVPLLSENDQPDHIINFAVECFAFLVKNLRDKNSFLISILKNVRHDESTSLGCGKLFFEMVKGLNGQFHSKGDEFLTILFDAFHKSEYKKYWATLNEIMVQTVGNLFDYIETKHISLYWNVLHESFGKALQLETDETSKESVQYLLHLLGQSMEYHHGKKVVEVNKIIELVIRVIDKDFDVEVMMTLSKIGALLLLSKNFQLDQLNASRLSKKILYINHAEVFESFVSNSIDSPQFEVLIMPDFLKYFERNINTTTLDILARITRQKSQRIILSTEEPESFIINLKNKKSIEAIVNRVIEFKLECSTKSFEEFVNSMVILPSLVSYDKDKIDKFLNTLIVDILDHLSDEENLKFLYILALAVSLRRDTTNDAQKLKIIEKILPFTTHKEMSLLSLKVLKFEIESLKKASLTVKLFEKVHSKIHQNLISPHQQIRLLTLQVLASFDHLKVAVMHDSDGESLFTVMKRIEEITSTIQTYRDQVLLLQKIEYDSTYFQIVRDTPYIEDALLFVLGLLNAKFQLLFDPTKAVLESFIEGADLDFFWNIYKEQLLLSIEQKVDNSEPDSTITDNVFINDEFSETAVLKNKSYDPIIYRVRLWKVLSDSKTTIQDRKQKDLVELFMNFLNDEFDAATDDDSDEAPKARQKLLISHLQVLKNFNNPKCVSRTKELKEIYYNFLIHRNFTVQKMALDCILQYKDESLVNYKELLHKMLDEKTFRSEITKFNMKDDIKEFHREEFVKILLPILYSKLTIKSTKKDQDGFRNRKEVIIRFMTNLSETEIQDLMNTVLGKIAAVKSTEQVDEVNVKVGELQSMHEFTDLVLKNIAGLYSTEFQRRTLQFILSIACCSVSSDSAIYKNLKQSCLSSVVYFFEHFDGYSWEEEKLDLLFKLFIWSNLENFHLFASQNISGLMRLFVGWSKNPACYQHLQRKDSNGNCAINSIMQLLQNKSTSSEVVNCVLDIIERLLTLKGDDETIETVNFGTKLLQPFINEMLVKLRELLNCKNQKSLNKRNLIILSRVTELVTDIDSSKLLLDILLPMTLRKSVEVSQDNEEINNLLTTLLNLFKVVDEPSYIRQLAPIFEHIHDVNNRKVLMKVFNQITTDDELSSLINDLNAYDRRWIEQPDFERRIGVFHKFEKMIKDGTDISLDLAVLFIYHCFYFLKHENDMAIRDNAGHFLRLVCCRVITQIKNDKQALDYFVAKTVLNLIQKRIKDEEKVRTEALNLLGALSRDHPNVHPVLGDLHLLCHRANRELDFFDNITHLQKFRHMKAMRRFTEISQKCERPFSVQTLTDFLLPISKFFLCSAEYKKKSKVIEAAIDYVTAICKYLPWNSYERLLVSYVRKMKSESGYQKQLVKLIPAIMDAFHFGLSEEIEKCEEECDELESEEIEDEVQDEIAEDDEVESTIPAATQTISNRVLRSLSRRLIPSLTRIITDISVETHKLNKQERRVKEKASMGKIPIAVSIVKLLKKLPKNQLDENLSQIVLKVAAFLKSTLKQVRATARHTLKEILIIVGPAYIEQIIGNLKSVLTKGFQLHVLSVTVFALMDVMKLQLKDMDDANKVLEMVVKICLDDIFGRNVDEKEMENMSRKAPEVKPSRKSFDTLCILAATITENYVLNLLAPLKSLLHDTQSKKTVIKIQECLVKIVNGLTTNPKMSQESLMILTHGIISESIPDLLPQEKKKQSKSKAIINDCFIIADEPKRRGATVANKSVKSSTQTNSYVLVEFGLELLHSLLRRKKIPDVSYLNPLVPMLSNSLMSSFLKVTMFAIKCLTIMWHHKLELPNLKDNVSKIMSEIFTIIHKYATSQISKKDNHFLLIKSCFKCIMAVMRQADYYEVNENQLKALLLYVEQDLQSMEKDNLAFVLLRSILDKKLMVPELHEIMRKVATISITSEIDEKRATIRPIVLTYLMEYPLGKKLDSLVKFFIAQLNYEEISGRESAILMMALMIKNFPNGMLCKFSGLFFLALGTRMVNDDSPSCREKIADAIETLIKQLDHNSCEQLFDIVSSLLKDKKQVHAEMGAQLTIRFVNAESERFEKRIPSILPLLLNSLKLRQTENRLSDDDEDDESPGKFVRVKRVKIDMEDEGFNEEAEKGQQVAQDHHLIQTLNAIIRIFELKDTIILDPKLASTIDDIGYTSVELLNYEHVWVRARSLRIINYMLRSMDVNILSKILLNESDVEVPRQFLYSKKEIQSVAFDMAVQLKSDIDEELLDTIVENIFEMAKLLKELPFEGMINDKKDFNLMWIIRRLRYSVNSEIVTASNCCVIRKKVFHLFELLIDVVDLRVLRRLANPMLNTLLREVVDGEHVIEELKQVANLTANKIKSLIGLQEFDKIRLDVQSKMLRKRVDRRKNLAQEKINNPVAAASRTISKQLKKQDIKKRKRQMREDGIVLPTKRRKFTQ